MFPRSLPQKQLTRWMAVSVPNSVLRLLLCEVGPYLFAIDVRRVKEVIEPRQATPIPGAPEAVLGVVNVRGVLTTVADLSGLLQVDSQRGEEAALVLMEHAGRRLGLLVDRVAGVEPRPEEGLSVEHELLEALGAGEAVKGVGEFGARPFFELDIGSLFHRVLGSDASESVEQGPSQGLGEK